MKRLEGKAAIVTGGASGIGKGASVLFAEEGACVAIGDLNEDAGRAAADEIKASGGKAIFVPHDVREEESWRGIVTKTVSAFGKVDILINNAGLLTPDGADSVETVSIQNWDLLIDVILKGTFLGIRSVVPEMEKIGGGRIVNTSSIASMVGLENLAAYSAAKGGVNGLTRQAAFDLAKKNIRVNAVAPGIVDTPILKGLTPEMYEANAAACLLNRLGKPRDIAAMMLFLASDDADFIDGMVYPVDGGWTIKGV